MTSVGVMASGANAGVGAILLEDCDNFTDAPWVVAGSVVVTAGGFTGNGFSIPASGAATVSYDIPAPQQTDQLTIGFRIKFSAIPGSAVAFLNWMSDAGATSHVTLRIYNPSGTLAFYRTSPTAVLGSVPAHGMVTGTWYYLEASLKLSDTNGQGVLHKDGIQLYATAGNEDTKSAGTKTVFDRIRFQGATGLAYIVDDIYIRNDLTFGP